MKKTNTNNLQTLSADYINYITYVKKLSQTSITSYKADMKAFLTFCEINNISELSQITLSTLHSFISYMSKESNSSATINRRIVCLKGFYSYLMTCKLVSEDITTDIKTVKLQKKAVKSLELSEAKRMIELASQDKRNGIRNKFIVEFMLSTGLRVAELVSVTPSMIINNELIINGKGNKERIIPLSDDLMNRLNEYTNWKIANGYTTEFLFTHSMNKKEQLSVRAVQNLTTDLLNQVGRNDLVTHSLRKTFASLLFESGNVDAVVIQRLLGHTNLNVTMSYLNVTKSTLRNAINSNPLLG